MGVSCLAKERQKLVLVQGQCNTYCPRDWQGKLHRLCGEVWGEGDERVWGPFSDAAGIAAAGVAAAAVQRGL